MTLQDARSRLAAAVEELWDAVGELVLITVEDQPGEGSLAAADAFAEQVSELQGEVATAREALVDAEAALTEDAAAGAWLPATAAALDAATWRYWRALRAHRPVWQLRTTVRRAGGGWPTWLRMAEQSAERCEEPLAQAGRALQAIWRETTFSPAAPAPGSRPVAPLPAYDMPRRTS